MHLTLCYAILKLSFFRIKSEAIGIAIFKEIPSLALTKESVEDTNLQIRGSSKFGRETYIQNFERQRSVRATRDCGHSQPRKSYQCIAALLERKRISSKSGMLKALSLFMKKKNCKETKIERYSPQLIVWPTAARAHRTVGPQPSLSSRHAKPSAGRAECVHCTINSPIKLNTNLLEGRIERLAGWFRGRVRATCWQVRPMLCFLGFCTQRAPMECCLLLRLHCVPVCLSVRPPVIEL
ncbi:hypothetical protein EVAR_39956_1 [Eumeta japonica]|uniref:Uncharacterized protein n=1 Tax=Eumeta variegata TaxID=151549 RepID=A0A4C1X4U5_EUMVA|nr:hypothetical protein EVAR_39956_1 [Eumeta japonica]